MIDRLPRPDRQNGNTHHVAFSADGRALYVASRESGDGIVEIFDSETRSLSRTVKKCEGVHVVCCHLRANHFLTSGSQVILWDSQTGNELRRFGPGGGATISTDGKMVAAVSDGRIVVWDYSNGEELFSFDGAGRIAFSADGTRLLGYFQAGVSRAEFRVWELSRGHMVFRRSGDRVGRVGRRICLCWRLRMTVL